MILFDNLKKLLSIKLVFLPPSKSKILIYDYASEKNGSSNLLFKRRKKAIYYNRFESINLYILVKAFLYRKYTNLRDNYKYHYFKSIKPKIIYTAIDNNPTFYLLKDIYPNATYIADQESMRDNIFVDTCKNLILTKKLNLKCDYFFVFGEYEKKRIEKIIEAKIITYGNTKNNFHNYINSKKDKRKRIVYISSKFRMRPVIEKKIFSYLIIFSKKFNYKLFFLDRPVLKNDPIFQNNKNILEKIFGKKNFSYLVINNLTKKINFLSNSELVTFLHSTLGYFLLSTGSKVLSFGHQKYNYSGKYKIKKEGLFWLTPNNYPNTEKKLLKIIKTNPTDFKKKLSKHSKNILQFKKNNLKKLEIINKILDNN